MTEETNPIENMPRMEPGPSREQRAADERALRRGAEQAAANNAPMPPLRFVTPIRPKRSEAEIAVEIQAWEDRERQERSRRMLAACGVPDDYRDAHRLTAKTLEPGAAVGWTDALATIETNALSQYIVGLVGPRGTGKTSLVSSAVLRMCEAGLEGCSAAYTSAYAYMLAVREGRAFGARVPESEVIRRHVTPQLLAVDEMHLVDASEREMVALQFMLQKRFDTRRCTVLVSNEKPEAFTQRIGVSLADRLWSRGDLIECTWPKVRKRVA